MQGLDSTAKLQLDSIDLAAPGRQNVAQQKRLLDSSTVNIPLLLQEISFEVFQQDRIAIVGPSGAGKTSLLRLLNRLIDPTRGQILYHGQNIRQIPVLQLRQQIVLVQQETRLLGRSVQEAILYPLQLRQLPPTEMRDRLSYWIEQLQIPTEWLEKTELQLSVGQRQWVAIARALVTQPKVLLLDEPTSALDRGKSQRLMEVLQALTQTQETAVIMVNHQLDLAEAFANRVLYLQQGRLLHNSLAANIDWTNLRDQLIRAELAETQEWE